MLGNVTTRQQPRLARPKSQDVEFRARSPVANAFYQMNHEVEEENDDSQPQIENTVSEHQYTCPWNKTKRLRSKEKVLGREELHPRPWGVRSPNEIQCTCKPAKNDMNRSANRPTTVNVTPIPRVKTAAHSELNKAINNTCKQIDKIKIFLTKEEVNEFSKKIRTSLEKKIKPKTTDSKPVKKTVSAHNQKTPPTKINNQNTRQLTPPTHHTNVDNMIMTQAALTPTMHMTPTAVVGTMESTNYVIELSPQPRNNAGEYKNIMSQVIPLSMGTDHKPKLVNVDGTYFAEIPNEFGIVPTVNQNGAFAAILPVNSQRSRSYSK
ncbi:hypothetical protein O3M35_008763 [Rhynocoris fuscipes]|uniref:Uncharacterized protein n=1 Tax=Rhynocoris fuscipes TaxID=488301 RepID=A0AAW1D7B8_9HEMI